MSKLLIATCTRAKTIEEFSTRPIYESLKKQCDMHSDLEFHIFKDNSQGLSQCYNTLLRDDKYKDYTILFVHDDIILEDLFLYEKLLQSPYSVTGLVGAKSFNKLADKLAWHLAAQQHSYVGEVAHQNKEGLIWTTVFGPTNCKVADLVEKELFFDEAFNFHFYDIAFCLKANEKQVTCGVLPIRVVHLGLGDSMTSSEWEQANQQFKQAYCV